MKRLFWKCSCAAALIAALDWVGIQESHGQTGGSSATGGSGGRAAGTATGGRAAGGVATGQPGTGQRATGLQSANPAPARAASPAKSSEPGVSRGINPAARATDTLSTADVTPQESATSGQNQITSDGGVTDNRTDRRLSDNRIDDRFTDRRIDSRFTDRRVDDRFTDSRTDSRFTDNRVDDRFTDSRVADRFTDSQVDDRFTDPRVDDRFSDNRLDDRFSTGRTDDRFPDARVTDSDGLNDAQLRDDLRQRGFAAEDPRGLTADGESLSTEGGRPQLGVTFYDSLTNGATIATVLPNTVAERAGLQRGDQILSINGRRFDDYRDALDYIDVFRGSRMDLIVKRQGEHVQLAADITARPRASLDNRPELGIWFDSGNNLVIGRTLPGSIAHSAGLRTGDRIVAIEGQPVTTQRALTRYLADLQPNEQVNVEVFRSGRRVRLDAELSEMARGQREFDSRDQAPAVRMAERAAREARTSRDSFREPSTNAPASRTNPRGSTR